ncbi:catalase [Clostridium rectalis]|uniref:catalase n=1 Tax=Clostridium rectalis TaxID=2040295 RepID=UPI000F64043A|nr:catalase [Clostridium rectalis]
MGKCKEDGRYLTSNQGTPVRDDANSLTVGKNGPVLMEDLDLIEKLSSFDRERIPERVVHAKGAGAKGYFKVTKCMRKYTRAKVFNGVGTKTPVTVRFSTVIGSKGSADTLRDPRGFATKFYTSEGNLDIVGNHIPVFFIRDAMKFPDMVHAFKPSPTNNVTDKNRFWDFISSSPESTNMMTFLFSDLGTIKSYRTIEGFGVNTYVWINENGHRVFIKYHWKPTLGVKTINRQEAEILAGLDPDVATRDLYDTIENGGKVEYLLNVQIMEMEEAKNLLFDPLDATKVWPEDKFPLIEVGKMTLNENPKNFFGEIEQVAFCPSNIVPGVQLSNDKLLQGRSFSYKDTQRHRIGANFQQLPINRPMVEVNNNTQDGAMRYIYNKGSINYKPNTLNDNRPLDAPKVKEDPIYAQGKLVRETIDKSDDFSQAGDRFRAMTEKDKNTLVDNIAADMWEVNLKIQLRAIENFSKADKEFGKRLKEKLKIK